MSAADELEAALNKIAELESIIRLKDERIKLLEEEHERHLIHQQHSQLLASPDIERPAKRGRKPKPRKRPQSLRNYTVRKAVYFCVIKAAAYNWRQIIKDPSPSTSTASTPESTRLDGAFESLRASILRSHKKSRPFDVIDEPPPRHTIKIDSGIFTTPAHFYRNVYARYEEQLPPRTVPTLPPWRSAQAEEKEAKTEEETGKESKEQREDISDEAFLRRHAKHEAEERRSIKKDKSYQREQFYNSRLRVRKISKRY